MNFVRTKSVIKNLMPISEIMMYGKGICKNNKILYVWFRTNRKNISNRAFCLIKLNGLKEERDFNEIAPKDTKMCLEAMFCFEAMKGLLVCVFLISRARLFLNATSIINVEQFSIFSAFCKILETAR